MMPNFYLVHWQLGLVLASSGKLTGALESLETAVRLSPEGPSVIAYLGWGQALVGRIDRARQVIYQLVQERKKKYIPAIDIAMLHETVGDIDRAFEWLDRAYRERALFLSWLGVWPPFERLCKDPHSATILSKMNLNSDARRK